MKLILDPASCKPIFVAPHRPTLSSLSTQQQTTPRPPPPPGTPHHLLCRERTSDLSIATARSVFPSAAIGSYLPRSCLSSRINQSSVFRSDISCFTLLFHHFLHHDLVKLTTLFRSACISHSARPSTADNRSMWREKCCLSVRLKVRQALPVSIYACAHCCCCCTSAHLGGGPSSTTNGRRLSPICLDTQADLRRRRVYSTPRFDTLFLTFSPISFSENSNKSLENYFEENTFHGKKCEFCEKVRVIILAENS